MLDKTVLDYNAYDVVNTYEVCDESKPMMNPNHQKTYNFTIRLLEPLMFMMSRGIRVDHERLSIVKKDVMKKLEVTKAELNELAGIELNALSPKQVKEYFYIKKGIKPYTKRNSKGTVSITSDDKAMQRIARGTSIRPGLHEARLVQEVRSLNKLYGTYLDITFDKDDRMRCSYNPRGAKFGRLSSSKTIFGTGMNMQNLPEEFKGFLVADPNYMIWEIDKAKAEWVVVAYLSGDSNMIKVIEEGLDPHVHTAHLMTRLPKELIEEEGKLIGHGTDQGYIKEVRDKMARSSIANKHAMENASFLPRTMSIRQCGKKSNHGLNYDEGFRTFALVNEMLESEARTIINLYKHQAYPGIPIWHKSIQEQLRHDRTLINCFGREYKFLGAWNEDLFKAAYSFLPQSTVADLVNTGIIDSYYDRSDGMLELDMLGQVHDSILGQYYINPKYFDDFNRMSKALQTVGSYMNTEMEYSGRKFYIDNDLKIGSGWGDMVEVDINADEQELSKQILGVYNDLSAGIR